MFKINLSSSLWYAPSTKSMKRFRSAGIINQKCTLHMFTNSSRSFEWISNCHLRFEYRVSFLNTCFATQKNIILLIAMLLAPHATTLPETQLLCQILLVGKVVACHINRWVRYSWMKDSSELTTVNWVCLITIFCVSLNKFSLWNRVWRG